MDRESISDLVHRLNDVELAVLLCLVADGHCILTSEENWLARLAAEVEGVCCFIFTRVRGECLLMGIDRSSGVYSDWPRRR